MINVTEPFLPPKQEFDDLINQIWERNWLTNNGPLVNRLESALKDYLRVDHLLFTGNGTIALQIAIKAMELQGEIITTPFSYVATTSSIIWEGCKPIFADIDPKRLTIDPTKIEELISEKTSAILATHVYGIPCHVEEIESIASKNGLRIIYDAAHAFGTKFKGKSILNYGDISTLSTHATKLFHTIEGGAVITRHATWLHQLSMMRNFGHNGPDKFDAVGINGKNSEFHAAMGIANLKHIEEILKQRKLQSEFYRENLHNFLGSLIEVPKDTEYNYAYFPVMFNSKEILQAVMTTLEKKKIFGRRYFYPSLNSLPYIEEAGFTPIANSISERILCLPLYHNLSKGDQDLICKLIVKSAS